MTSAINMKDFIQIRTDVTPYVPIEYINGTWDIPMKDKKKKIYIVAGNYNEYRDYVNRKKLEDPEKYKNIELIYVNSEITLLGLSEIEGFYIGTYYERNDIEDIKRNIQIIKHTHNPTNTSNNTEGWPIIKNEAMEKLWDRIYEKLSEDNPRKGG